MDVASKPFYRNYRPASKTTITCLKALWKPLCWRDDIFINCWYGINRTYSAHHSWARIKLSWNYIKFNMGNISYFNSRATGIHFYDANSRLYEYGTRKI